MSADETDSDETPRERGQGPRQASRQQPGGLVLTEEISAELSGTGLFYPSSGRDWAAPVQLFLPNVSSFWLVDIGYREDAGAELITALSRRDSLEGDPQVDAIEGTVPYVGANRRCGPQQPFVKTARFARHESGKSFDVHWCGHDGPDTLQRLPEPLGIFFYRGDGDGEGGSSIPWLSESPGGSKGAPGEIHEVLDRLIDGGLLVTDGSNTFNERGPGSYEELGRFFLKGDQDPAVAHRQVRPFVDRYGRSFRCTGYLVSDGYGKGPTLVWTVRKAGRR